MKRKICVFTGTRAEYGLLKPLMDKIKQDDSLKLQLLVSGSHVSEEFGLTYKNIENDGFFITGTNQFLNSNHKQQKMSLPKDISTDSSENK